jgi:hypothetical protein
MAFRQTFEFIVGFWGREFGDRIVTKEEVTIKALDEHAARRKLVLNAHNNGRFVRFILPAQTVGV